MKYVRLGNSDLNVSRICLGCMGFGDSRLGHHSWTLDYGASRDIIKYALDRGINFFDTAIVYADGTSEQYTGKALRELAKRSDVVVATKFPVRSESEKAAGINGREHVERMLDESLANLGMDYVDLYICHMWDYGTPIDEIMEGLNNAVRSGKARAVGMSNCYAYQLAKANALAEKEGFPKFVSIQGHYNLLFREEEREMGRLCAEDGIAMTPYSALASGRLSRLPGVESARAQSDHIAKGKYDATAEQDAIIIGRVAELARKRGVSMTEIALAWLLTKVAAPIVGATKMGHVADAVSAVDFALSEEEAGYLEEAYVPHRLVGVMQFNNRTR